MNKTTGVKFGKSEEGAVWLDSAMTSIYAFYQFWLNVDDGGVEDYLKIYTLLERQEIERIMSEFTNDPGGRVAQKTLAYEATTIVHGREQADAVVKLTNTLFGSGETSQLRDSDWQLLKADLPVVVAQDDVPQLLVDAKLANSKSEARTFLASGAISLNGEKIMTEIVTFSQGNNLLKRGKNNFAIVVKQ
jgi:tyrosyl-tRNA synthetase